MPIYPCKCPACGHEEEQFAKMVDSDALACSACKQPTSKVPCRPSEVGNRRLYGKRSRSIMEGWLSSEVQEARELVGPDLEGCIKDDGSVVYESESQRKAYVRKIEAIEDKAADARVVAKQQAAESAKRGESVVSMD